MGLGTVLIAVAIIIIGFPIVMAFAGQEIDSLLQDLEDKQDAQDFGNNPSAGDVRCDLKIHVEGELDFDRTSGIPSFLQIGNLEVYMGNAGGYPQVVNAVWSNCRIQSFSLVSFFGNIQRLALVQGDSFELEMTGKSNTNGKALTENSNTQVWRNDVEFTTVTIPIVELTSVDLPVSWQTDYFLTNVKIDDYELRFFAVGGSINNMGTNKPLQYDVDRPLLT